MDLDGYTTNISKKGITCVRRPHRAFNFPLSSIYQLTRGFLLLRCSPHHKRMQNKLAQIIYLRAVLLSAFDSQFYIVTGFADCKLKSMQCGLLVSITECIMVELKTCNRVIIRFTDSVKRVSGTHQSITATLTRFQQGTRSIITTNQ